MASRFVVADNDVIAELKPSSEKSYTRKSTNWWVVKRARMKLNLNFTRPHSITYTNFRSRASSIYGKVQ
jgi:hypothetical protein